jgi:hypothetical protein
MNLYGVERPVSDYISGAGDKFRQLEELLPTPNEFRSASGAPGYKYWQQDADYEIEVEVDDENQKIIGSETITYSNNSPDTLTYLWVQLDQNSFEPDSVRQNSDTVAGGKQEKMSFKSLKKLLARKTFDGGAKILSVTYPDGTVLKHTVVQTMMRLDLRSALASGESVTFKIDWEHNIIEAKTLGGRGGYEYFEEDKNYIYEIAQWFPRMAAYTDVNGWQNKQFIGRGEFTLEFGDYLVKIKAPADHVVTATGRLQNEEEVLTQEQINRLEDAQSAKTPLFVITPEEAKKNELSKLKTKKTWIFKANNVRDFAFASSRKFIWDAQGYGTGSNPIMAMSFYPNEAEPLWSKYSTHSIIHTLEVYSRYTFDYPYPVAISVNGPVGGMEYPMICFNGPRPEKDGTYSARTKHGLIGVVIHEVGHNYFPMIVNSDERQWTWMDEGLNTFLENLAEMEWQDDVDFTWIDEEKQGIIDYMASDNRVPIMVNSESILQFGYNAYGLPAFALNVLRETILGRELFDFAFKEYARRWKFKRPQPSDFFRTMEDASGVDLDWFWRGWFYSTDHVDISIEEVTRYEISNTEAGKSKKLDQIEKDLIPLSLSKERNANIIKRVEKYPELLDFYNTYNELDLTEEDKKSFEEFIETLDEWEKELLDTGSKLFFYTIDFKNNGGLVMPILLQVNYADGTSERLDYSVENWRHNPEKITKLVVSEKEIIGMELDPRWETGDGNVYNNSFPRQMKKGRFDLFKNKKEKNPMQKAAGGSENE